MGSHKRRPMLLGRTYLQKYGYKNGIDQETITMMEDHLHRIWFISKRNGLNLLDEKKAKYINFNQRYRLPDGLKSMTEDKRKLMDMQQ